MQQVQRAGLAFVIGALLSAPAAATTSFYTNEAAFLDAGGATLSFEGFNAPRAGAALQNYAGFTLGELAGSSNSIQSSRSNNVLPAGLVEGAGYVFYDDNGNSRAVFSFDGTINAFGIFVTSNFDGVPGAQGNMEITGGFGSDTLGLTINQPRFWGVIADAPFSTITFTMPLEPLVAFDALRHGTIVPPSPPAAVPEPQSWALLLLGFALVGFARRRRRAAA